MFLFFITIFILAFFAAQSPKNYSSISGAETGQTAAHVPHSIHLSGSITYFSSPSEMHSTGHFAAHAPHLIHASVILYAI